MTSHPRVYRHSFAGGEMSPEMTARIDDAKHQQGVALARNFVIHAQGPAQRRPPTDLVAETKTSSKRSRLISFAFSPTETMCIELGEGYFRFHTDGAQVLNSSTPPDNAYFVSQTVTFSASTNLATWPVAHGLSTYDKIAFTTTGTLPTTLVGGFPGTLNPSQVYGVNTTTPPTASTEMSIGTSPEVPSVIDLTSAGTGTHTGHYPYLIGDVVERRGAATFSSGTDFVTTTRAHGLTDGYEVFFTTTGTLPPELSLAASYFVVNSTATTYQLSLTSGGAAINLTTNGTGSHTWHFGMTGYPAKRVTFQCIEAHLGIKPPSAQWLASIEGEPYEIPNTYAEADLFEINYAQSRNVLTLVHVGYPPMELTRISDEVWTFTPITFSSTISQPVIGSSVVVPGQRLAVGSVTNANPAQITIATDHHYDTDEAVQVTGTVGSISSGVYLVDLIPGTKILTLKQVDGGATVASSSTTVTSGYISSASVSLQSENTYTVTALTADGIETQHGNEVTLTNNLFVPGSSNTVRWSPIAGAARYRVYKRISGLYGFIGEVEHVDGEVDFGFTDANIGPDLALSPPQLDLSLSGTEYPGSVCYYEQRRAFARTATQGQDLWMTRSGTPSDLSYSLPTKDTDRIYRRIEANEANTILHMVALGQILVLTNSTEYRIATLNSDALTPTSITARPQTFIGTNHVRPLVTNGSLLFAAARGGRVWETGYSNAEGRFSSGDLCLRSGHLFDDDGLVDSAVQKAPMSIAWWVSTTGKLLGLTYSPQEQIGAWHQHDTQGVFESVAVIAEGREDRLYAIVNRTIDGTTRRFVERMRPLAIPEAIEDCGYSDCGIEYDGSPQTVFSGLDHLIGKQVAILADGKVHPVRTVNGSGQITLAYAASKVRVGLAYTSQLKTLPVALGSDGAYGQSRVKNVNRAVLRVKDSARFRLGPTASQLYDSAEIPAGQLVSGQVRATVEPAWLDGGQLLIEQSDPLPLTVVALTLEVAMGGG